MHTVFARKALLTKGWRDNVRLQVAAGRIDSLASDALPDADEQQVDILIPGLCNAHSHAFQRALAGRTEQRAPAGEDNFWSWRTQMYKLANKVSAEQLAAIATQAYNEMLQAGYTSVAEFHYLHRRPEATGDAMFNALQAAAAASGIRLIYVPVLYERAGFDDSEPTADQRAFVMTLDKFLAHHQRCTENAAENTSVAIGAHSLRAVTASSLRAIAEVSRDQNIPLHLHIAEQTAEVDQCIAVHRQRPVEYLLDNFDVDARWCLVHATHIDAAESEALAASGAVVCICPTTEANLGDGLFPLRPFLEHGGRIAIGSDSQSSIDPFEELRWLEYGQRLASQSRNVISIDHEHVGFEVFHRALAGGAQAAGQGPGGIVEGAIADFIALRSEDAMLLEHAEEHLLDALIFSGYRRPIDGVMACGRWQVSGGAHVNDDAARVRFRHALRGLR